MAVVFALAFAVGIYLTAVAGPVVVAIGLSSIAAAIAYTGGPYPLGYHGLGDVFVMAFFGFVAVCGTAFVQAGHVPPIAWAAALPVGALATAILVVNNVRDCETDVKAGKRTLPVRFGRSVGARRIRGARPHRVRDADPARAHARAVGMWALLPVLSAPIAVRLMRRVWSDTGRALNATLVGTARLLFVHADAVCPGDRARGDPDLDAHRSSPNSHVRWRGGRRASGN